MNCPVGGVPGAATTTPETAPDHKDGPDRSLQPDPSLGKPTCARDQPAGAVSSIHSWRGGRLAHHDHDDLEGQAMLARERIEQAGPDRPDRSGRRSTTATTGRYDCPVSTEMIEAVGWRDFRPTSRSAGAERRRFDAASYDHDRRRCLRTGKRRRAVSSAATFSRRCLAIDPRDPSLSRSGDRHDDRLSDEIRSITPAPGRGRRWFNLVTDRLESFGYDDRFLDVGPVPLAEAGFRSGRNSDFQMLLAKPQSPSLIQLAGKAPPGPAGNLAEANAGDPEGTASLRKTGFDVADRRDHPDRGTDLEVGGGRPIAVDQLPFSAIASIRRPCRGDARVLGDLLTG